MVSEEVEDLCKAKKPFLGGFNAGNGKALVGSHPTPPDSTNPGLLQEVVLCT